MSKSYFAAQFAEEFNVSRETMAHLTGYAALLGRWQQKINLVGPATLRELWVRHMADSAQIFELSGRRGGVWVDLGSGAGFPGLVIALLMAGRGVSGKVHLVESDFRKSAFLRTVIRELGLSAVAEVHDARIECLAQIHPEIVKKTDFLSARALAPLPQLLGLIAPFYTSSTDSAPIAWLSKGQHWQEELTHARNWWKLKFETHRSRTSDKARILEVRHIAAC